MKKTLLLACASVLVATNALAQNPTLRLASILADDDRESDYYYYSIEGNIYNRHYHDDLNGETFYDTLMYNENNQIIEEATYQDLSYHGDFQLVTKCCYSYNDKGQLEWRENYNSFGAGSLSKSARITYEYDELGRKVKDSQYWASDLEHPFMIIEYTYNERGLLESAIESMEDFFSPGNFELLGVSTYEYDEQDRLVKDAYSYITEGMYELASYESYSYDENGEMVKSQIVYANGNVDSSREYEYDKEVNASDIVYPRSYEFKLNAAFAIKYKRTTESVFKSDENAGTLALAYTRIYSYEDCPTGVRDVTAPSAIAYFDADNKVMVMGCKEDCMVRIIAVNGNEQQQVSTTSGKADLSSLPAGTYIAAIKATGQKPTYLKFVVK